MKNLINIRKKLERKYTNLAINFGYVLNEKNRKAQAISPTAYYYLTGINSDSFDSKIYRKISKKIHQFGERGEIESKVFEILGTKKINFLFNFEITYFFELKNKLLENPKNNYDYLNYILQKRGLKALKKAKYNYLINLLKKWGKISVNFHYKLNGAEKRKNKKNIREVGKNGF